MLLAEEEWAEEPERVRVHPVQRRRQWSVRLCGGQLFCRFEFISPVGDNEFKRERARRPEHRSNARPFCHCSSWYDDESGLKRRVERARRHFRSPLIC